MNYCYDDVHRMMKFEEETMNEKEKALLEMRNALLNLRKAWFECLYAFGNACIDCNDYILGSEETEDEYPFYMSFDEMMVTDWCEGAIERIEDELQ